jgi:hypothetical protein
MVLSRMLPAFKPLFDRISFLSQDNVFAAAFGLV